MPTMSQMTAAGQTPAASARWFLIWLKDRLYHMIGLKTGNRQGWFRMKVSSIRNKDVHGKDVECCDYWIPISRFSFIITLTLSFLFGCLPWQESITSEEGKKDMYTRIFLIYLPKAGTRFSRNRWFLPVDIEWLILFNWKVTWHCCFFFPRDSVAACLPNALMSLARWEVASFPPTIFFSWVLKGSCGK